MSPIKDGTPSQSFRTGQHPSKWGQTLARCVVAGLSGWVCGAGWVVCNPWDEPIGPERPRSQGGAQMKRVIVHTVDSDKGTGGQERSAAPIEKQEERAIRILLAYNGSELSRAALQALIKQHRAQNTEVEVLYAVPLHVWDGEGSQAQGLVDEAAEVLRSAGFKVRTRILKGATSDAIVDAAEDWSADLIVLGWHGRTALRRFWSGSISDAVTHHVDCSVELVRVPSHGAHSRVH
jgi:nucleotide-binding universal stress UspA family protein